MSWRERFRRQLILPELGEAGQRRLAEARVLVVGCGALGSHTAVALLRAGVGNLVLVDRDVVELSNLHRVAAYREHDVGTPKAVALKQALEEIDPQAHLEAKVVHFGPQEAEELVPRVDLVVDGLDNLESRYVVNDACVKHGVGWVYTAVLATHGMCMPIIPGEGPCLRCLFPTPPPPGALPTCATAGILGPLPAVLGAWQASVAIQLLVAPEEVSAGELQRLDLWARRWDKLQVERSPDCPCCGRREFEFLAEESRCERLCGDVIQIRPVLPGGLDLEELKARLSHLGEVKLGRGVVVAKLEGVSFTVFPDGRALVKGVQDPARAQALYDRYIAR
ncbi:MAG TPA: thiazole biosynthesis adenylyltransferase ThiF [Candidatus Acetothermia bacterium]|nr:thiazole biosynthesis adenylyltransferase ThiF [Candidatus Acetothermia bacterium]